MARSCQVPLPEKLLMLSALLKEEDAEEHMWARSLYHFAVFDDKPLNLNHMGIRDDAGL